VESLFSLLCFSSPAVPLTFHHHHSCLSLSLSSSSDWLSLSLSLSLFLSCHSLTRRKGKQTQWTRSATLSSLTVRSLLDQIDRLSLTSLFASCELRSFALTSLFLHYNASVYGSKGRMACAVLVRRDAVQPGSSFRRATPGPIPVEPRSAAALGRHHEVDGAVKGRESKMPGCVQESIVECAIGGPLWRLRKRFARLGLGHLHYSCESLNIPVPLWPISAGTSGSTQAACRS